jgi:hypothetical protein
MPHDKKGKVGILSINKYSLYMNYGAALHSFAFQKYLDKRGVDNVIIDYLPQHIGDYRLDFPIISAIKRRSGLKHIIGCLLRLISAKIKYDKFMKFFRKNYKMVNCPEGSFSKEDFEKNKTIDIFDFERIICESDVIWSPKTNKGFDRAFFCDYEFSKSMIKIAYAASISNTFFNEDEEKEFVPLLKNFDYISVRERQTAEYVQKFTDKKVFHVLDPVLLLDSEDYQPYIKYTKKCNYLLAYNCMHNDRIMMKRAKEFAKAMNWDLIEISNFDWNRIHNKVYSSLGIEEFLGFFLNAQFVVTNGFHGMCFSIIFRKNFYVFERDSIDLKIKSLISVLDLHHCFITGNKKNDKFVNNTIDYDVVYKRLDSERRRSINFINNAIIPPPPPLIIRYDLCGMEDCHAA